MTDNAPSVSEFQTSSFISRLSEMQLELELMSQSLKDEVRTTDVSFIQLHELAAAAFAATGAMNSVESDTRMLLEIKAQAVRQSFLSKRFTKESE